MDATPRSSPRDCAPSITCGRAGTGHQSRNTNRGRSQENTGRCLNRCSSPRGARPVSQPPTPVGHCGDAKTHAESIHRSGGYPSPPRPRGGRREAVNTGTGKEIVGITESELSAPPARADSWAGGCHSQTILRGPFSQLVLFGEGRTFRTCDSVRGHDRDFVVVCFGKPEDAEAFAKRLGGE